MHKTLILAVSLLIKTSSGFAAEPAANPAALQFSNVRTYALNMSFIPVAADGYLVIKSNAPVSFIPADGIAYEKGQGLPGGGKVMSVGNISAFAVRNVYAGQTAHFAVFAYNGSGSNIDYRQSAPARDSLRLPEANPGNYYGSLHPSSSNFLSDLTALIKNHTYVNYSDFDGNIVPAIYERDTTGSRCVVNCWYSGETKTYSPPFGFTNIGYSREHRLPKSWFTTGGTANTTIQASDYHNLELTNLNEVNTKRSNNPYGEVNNASYTYLGCKLGTDSRGKLVFEPMEQQKGDAARAVFYMMTAYNGTGGSWAMNDLLTLSSDQDISVLYNWHRNDPPDAFEKTRHEYVFFLQNNRNPFIDHPEWVDCIEFDVLIKNNNCQTLGSSNNDLVSKVYPIPSSDFIQWQTTGSGSGKAILTDLNGKILMETKYEGAQGNASMHHLPSGLYLLQLEQDGRQYHSRIAKW